MTTEKSTTQACFRHCLVQRHVLPPPFFFLLPLHPEQSRARTFNLLLARDSSCPLSDPPGPAGPNLPISARASPIPTALTPRSRCSIGSGCFPRFGLGFTALSPDRQCRHCSWWFGVLQGSLSVTPMLGSHSTSQHAILPLTRYSRRSRCFQKKSTTFPSLFSLLAFLGLDDLDSRSMTD